MRLIDADALIEHLRKDPLFELVDKYGIINVIASRPAINPVWHEGWIPCSERLPKNDDWVIVTVLDERGDTSFRYTDFGWYLEAANCWIVDAEQRTDVTAWMPLPRPYKSGDTE